MRASSRIPLISDEKAKVIAKHVRDLKLKGVQKSYNSPIHVALGMKD